MLPKGSSEEVTRKGELGRVSERKDGARRCELWPEDFSPEKYLWWPPFYQIVDLTLFLCLCYNISITTKSPSLGSVLKGSFFYLYLSPIISLRSSINAIFFFANFLSKAEYLNLFGTSTVYNLEFSKRYWTKQ